MGQLQRALPHYLEALNLLPGFLFTLAVDRNLISLFGPQEKSTYDFIVQTLAEHGLGKRKRHVAEKLVRIVHLSAFLIGLLAHNNQKIFWMTDHDAICANNELHQQTLNLFQRVLGLYARPSYNFPLIAGARPFPERNLQMLDLLSITDVVAGSLAHYLSQRKKAPSPAEIKVKTGAEHVLRWLTNDGIGLKKMNVSITCAPNNTIQASTLEFALEKSPENVTIIPVVV